MNIELVLIYAAVIVASVYCIRVNWYEDAKKSSNSFFIMSLLVCILILFMGSEYIAFGVLLMGACTLFMSHTFLALTEAEKPERPNKNPAFNVLVILIGVLFGGLIGFSLISAYTEGSVFAGAQTETSEVLGTIKKAGELLTTKYGTVLQVIALIIFVAMLASSSLLRNEKKNAKEGAE